MSQHAFLDTTLRQTAPLDMLDRIQAGLPSESLAAFKAATGLSDEDIARLLNIGGRTLTRLRAAAKERLPSDLSDRLFALASIYRLAEEVFGDIPTASGWLNAPQFGLGHRLPRDLLTSEFGRQQVRTLLQRIEFGQLA